MLDDWSGNEVAVVNGSRIITWYLGEGGVPGGPPRHSASIVLLKTTEQAPPGRNRLPTPGYDPEPARGTGDPLSKGRFRLDLSSHRSQGVSSEQRDYCDPGLPGDSPETQDSPPSRRQMEEEGKKKGRKEQMDR